MATRAGQEAEDDLLRSPRADELEAIAARVGTAALERRCTISTAESCTGGLVGHAITEMAGSSAYYQGGVISYSNEAKRGLLGVSAETIERHGAVSAQVAKSMAEGVRDHLQADYGVAVTGIAGPDGGSADKPVGLTYVAVAGPERDEVRRHHWGGDRSSNKLASARAALQLLLEQIEAADVAAGSHR